MFLKPFKSVICYFHYFCVKISVLICCSWCFMTSIQLIAKVESGTMDKVKETITWKLRNLKGVKSTLTLIVTK